MKTIKVALTGAAGQIAYSLLPRLCSGEVFGDQTKIDLRLLEITPALPALEGVVMELEDCAFSRLEKITVTDKLEEAFKDVDFALLVGARPRGPGMERSDLIKINGPIFVEQGKALGLYAAPKAHVAVIGNPANTNCLIAKHQAKRAYLKFSALTRLDQNRVVSLLAKKAGVNVEAVKNVIIWGNHSATQFPDVSRTTIDGRKVAEVILDDDWLKNDFIKIMQKRGAAVIKARGSSSALSAAKAICDHVKSFISKTPADEYFSAAVVSDGSYGIDEGLIFSFPIQSHGDGSYKIVQDLELSDFAKEKIDITLKELKNEREVVKDLLI